MRRFGPHWTHIWLSCSDCRGSLTILEWQAATGFQAKKRPPLEFLYGSICQSTCLNSQAVFHIGRAVTGTLGALLLFRRAEFRVAILATCSLRSRTGCQSALGSGHFMPKCRSVFPCPEAWSLTCFSLSLELHMVWTTDEPDDSDEGSRHPKRIRRKRATWRSQLRPNLCKPSRRRMVQTRRVVTSRTESHITSVKYCSRRGGWFQRQGSAFKTLTKQSNM